MTTPPPATRLKGEYMSFLEQKIENLEDRIDKALEVLTVHYEQATAKSQLQEQISDAIDILTGDI